MSSSRSPLTRRPGWHRGAKYLVEEHRDLFSGVTEGVGEVGGFSVAIGDQRLYVVQTAEKGIAWLRLTATGTAGHGSMIHNDNAVTSLAAAVARIGQHEWPVHLIPSVRDFLVAASAAIGLPFSPDDPWGLLGKLGPAARMVGATLKHTANPTGLKAGYKVNAIPQTATAEVDCRFLPGLEEEFFAEIDRLLGDNVRREFIHHDIAVETTADGDLDDAMAASLLAEDPAAKVVPYCLSAGTTLNGSARSVSGASGSARSSCRRTWTSPECSTASTSACPWMACALARECSTGSLTWHNVPFAPSASYPNVAPGTTPGSGFSGRRLLG